jgi:hypothetical protein
MSSPPSVMPDVQLPRLTHLPPNVATSAAVEAIEFAEEAAGLTLDPWQRWVVEHALAERRDGQWAAFEVGLVCPRQNGKNFILEVIQLACIYLFADMTLVHSAHKLDTSVEHFNRMKFLLESSDELSELLFAGDRSFVTANGKEMIRFRTGQRILFKARHKGGARGFTGDKVFLDEAYDLAAAPIGAMIPTLSTRPNPQVYYTSSAPHANSSVLHAVRARAMAAAPGEELFYAEWGNDDGVTPDDVEAIERANPAVQCGRISAEYIQREIRTFSGTPELVEEHARERLGIATMPDAGFETIVPREMWEALKDKSSKLDSHENLALDVSPDRKWASLGAAGRRADGKLHVELVDHRPSTGWVVESCVKLHQLWKVPIRIETTSPAASFIAPLLERGVEVTEVTQQEHAKAVGQFIDAALNNDLRHMGSTSLDSALNGAVLRASGDVQLWGRRASKVDITPLVAVTIALGGVPEGEPVFAGDYFVNLDELLEDDA